MVAVVHSTTRYTKYYSIRVPPIDRPFLQLTNLWLLVMTTTNTYSGWLLPGVLPEPHKKHGIK